MKKIAIKFPFFLIVLLFCSSLYASHYMGGEITWECLSNGQYRFTMKVYRECNGIQFNASEILTVTGNPSITQIPMTRISQVDISPQCNAIGPHITCANAPQPNLGAVEEQIYQSAPVTLSGVPPVGGWIFQWGSCCRNPSTNINNASSLDWLLRAVMYRYTPPGATTPQNANPCFDNSPYFAERPSTVICTGYPFTYNHNASDKELDSLAYEWAPPLINLTTPISTWAAGYSFSSPLPSTVHNPNNIPATVNPYTGEISFTSFTQGAFQTVVKISAYKCGQKVAEIFREMQIVLLPCGTNNPPAVTAPFINPVTSLYSNYIDTVYAGELVTFPLSGTDFDYLPNGQPETMSITASGIQFGTNFSSTTTGCLNPPCAVLSPPPPITGQFGVQTNFSWQTTCDHLVGQMGCGNTSNVYNFLIKVQDDFCPAPAINISTISIVVIILPVLPPELRCISVDANGDVTLNWIPPSDIHNSFNSYLIYSSNSASGPFTLVDSVFNISTSTYTHVGANANSNNLFYFIKTLYGCGGTPIYLSQPTDTIESILLSVSNSGTGNAMLDWNAIHTPLLPTSSLYYNIFREYPAGSWTLIDSTQSLQYIENITLCNATINYRVEITDSLGCICVSSIDGDLFQDLTAPSTPTLDSVSINPTSNKAILGWSPSSSPDCGGYVIYQNTGGIWTAIDTIWSTSITTYTNPNSNASNASESYTIAAFDTCMNISPMVNEQNTIFLTSQIDVCGGNVTLNWTPYINMNPAINGYNIFVSENNGPFTLLNTNASSVTSYIHNNLTPFSTYCYQIIAFNDDGETSTSNKTCILASSPKQPEFVYLKSATVVNNTYVDVTFFVDTAAYVSSYRILRADNSAGPFVQIASLPPSTSPNVAFSDMSALVTFSSYYYKVVVVDSCNIEAITSNIGRTILLVAEGLGDMTNELRWNDYEAWSGNVDSYSIYRKVDNNFEPLTVVPFGTNTFVDNVANYTTSEGKFTYYVLANEAPGNIYNFIETSMSNESVCKQIPKLFVPSAFVPKGYNTIFKPFGVFIDAADYKFFILNRWGQIIFETQDPNIGWDGTYKNLDAPYGVYTYVIEFRNPENVLIQKRGTVTLLR